MASQEQIAAEAAAGSSSDRTGLLPIAASSSNKSHQKQHKEEKQEPNLAAKGKVPSKLKAATSTQSVFAPDNQRSSDSDTPSKRKRQDSESSVESELLTHPSDAKQSSSSSKKRSLSASSDDSIPSPKPVRTTRGAARRTRSQDTAVEQHPTTAGSSSGVAEKRVKGGKGSKKPKEEEVKEEQQEDDNKQTASTSTASGKSQRKGQQKKGKEPVKKEESDSEGEEKREDPERRQHFVGHQLTGLINHFPDVEVAPGTRITRATTRCNSAFKDPSSTTSSTPSARTPDISHPHQVAPLDVAKTGQSISSFSGLSAATNQNRAVGSRDRAATGPSGSAASIKRKRKTSELSATAAAASSVGPSASAAAIKTEPESSGFGETFAAGGAQSSASLNPETCATSISFPAQGLRNLAAGLAYINTDDKRPLPPRPRWAVRFFEIIDYRSRRCLLCKRRVRYFNLFALASHLRIVHLLKPPCLRPRQPRKLQDLCLREIVRCVSVQQLQELPLPVRLIDELKAMASH